MKSKKTVQRLRAAAIIMLTTIAILAVVEVAVRSFVTSVSAPNVPFALVGGRAASVNDIRLKSPPDYVTDKNGIWVANSASEGINSQGYRSPEFAEPAGGRKTILMLGDSFTYGNSAVPFRSAFPDLVRAAGYKVCNCGIPGTATIQYAAQAKLLTPAIHPDAVAVMFYTGNDFEVEPPIVPGRPRNYDTNIGLLGAYDELGQPLTLAQAAQRYISLYGPGISGQLRRTLYSSGLWTLMTALTRSPPSAPSGNEIVLQNLRDIQAAAAAVGARFELFLIPTRTEYVSEQSEIDAASQVLSEFHPRVPQNVSPDWYADLPDPHFNNTGHAHMAEFILEVLKEDGLPPHAATPATAP